GTIAADQCDAGKWNLVHQATQRCTQSERVTIRWKAECDNLPWQLRLHYTKRCMLQLRLLRLRTMQRRGQRIDSMHALAAKTRAAPVHRQESLAWFQFAARLDLHDDG